MFYCFFNKSKFDIRFLPWQFVDIFLVSFAYTIFKYKGVEYSQEQFYNLQWLLKEFATVGGNVFSEGEGETIVIIICKISWITCTSLFGAFMVLVSFHIWLVALIVIIVAVL